MAKPKSDGTLKIKNVHYPLYAVKKLYSRPFTMRSRKRLRQLITIKSNMRRYTTKRESRLSQHVVQHDNRSSMGLRWRRSTISSIQSKELQYVGDVSITCSKKKSDPNLDQKLDMGDTDCHTSGDDNTHVDGHGLNHGHDDVYVNGDSDGGQGYGYGSCHCDGHPHGHEGYGNCHSYGAGQYSDCRFDGVLDHTLVTQRLRFHGSKKLDIAHQYKHMSQVPVRLSCHRSFIGKYTPKCFEEIVGQNMVIKALSNAFTKGTIAPLYLFHGPRGTGKTSVARLFATSINCWSSSSSRRRKERERAGKESINSIYSMPCGSCRHCKKLALGVEPSNIREIDAACHNSLESMSSLLRQINSLASPQAGRYKIFIIDECHFLTGEAWDFLMHSTIARGANTNSLSNYVFIFVTTNIEHLPRALMSRCHKFTFSKVKDAEIILKMKEISNLEGIDIEQDALQLIAARSDGSLCEAEITLDQLSSLGQKITIEVIRDMVGLITDGKLVELLELAFSANNVVGTVRCVRELVDSGIEPMALLSQLANLITDLLAGDCNHGFFSNPPGIILRKQDVEKLRQALRILSKAEKQLRICGNNKTTWLTAALLQLSNLDTFFPNEQPGHASNIHEYSISARTSVTQSPLTLLETSDKETGDLPCINVSLHEGCGNANDKTSKQQWLGDRRTVDWSEESCEVNPHDDPPQQCRLRRIHMPSSVVECRSNSFSKRRHVQNITPCSRSKNVRKSACRIYKETRSKADRCTESQAPPLVTSRTSNYSRRDLNPDSISTKAEVYEASHSTMDDLWEKLLEGSPSSVLRQILSGEGKLVSLSVLEAHAIAHLEFQSIEDKKRADARKETIAKSFQMALGCPVQVNLSLAVCGQEGSKKGETVIEKPVENAHPAGPTVKKCQRRVVKSQRNEEEVINLAEFLYVDQKDPSNANKSRRLINNNHNPKAGLSYDDHMVMTNLASDGSLIKCENDEKLLRSNSTYYSTSQGYGVLHTKAVESHSTHIQSRDDKITSLKKERLGTQEARLDTTIDLINAKISVDASNHPSVKVDKSSTNYNCQCFGVHEPNIDDMENRTPAYRTGLLCWKGAWRNNSTNDINEVKVRAERRALYKNNLSMIGTISTLAGVGRNSHRER